MNDMRQITMAGRHIEEASFAIIDAEVGSVVGPHVFSAGEWQVVRRVIHATADFDFARTMTFGVGGTGAVGAGVAALRRGSTVVCDVQMIAGGLSRERLAAFGSGVCCFIGDEDVVLAAFRGQNRTRAAEAMRKAHRLGLLDGAIVVIGNAPTALAEVQRLVTEEGAAPALVVGVPVGFVGAAEAKEAALSLPVPYVVARGRKGGSPVAVAIVHALLALAVRSEQ
jgi:precorrin-8X/cobalt-precorrin-8 methylmutase